MWNRQVRVQDYWAQEAEVECCAALLFIFIRHSVPFAGKRQVPHVPCAQEPRVQKSQVFFHTHPCRAWRAPLSARGRARLGVDCSFQLDIELTFF
jgi:hypothetical protein